jgi:hypothetical protein
VRSGRKTRPNEGGGAFTKLVHERERAADDGKEIGMRVIGQVRNSLKSLSPSNAN